MNHHHYTLKHLLLLSLDTIKLLYLIKSDSISNYIGLFKMVAVECGKYTSCTLSSFTIVSAPANNFTIFIHI